MVQILEQIKLSLTRALKEKDEPAISALRFLLSDLHNEEIARQQELSDDEVVTVVKRQVKKHQESIEAFRNGGRADLVQKEEREKAILESFLPAQMGEEEIRAVVKEIVGTDLGDFGQVMGQVMGKLKGQADGAVAARIVREELGRND